LSLARGVDAGARTKLGSPGVPMPGFKVKLLDDATGAELTAPNQKGVLTIDYPLPPGCLQTVWGDDKRFVQTYWQTFAGQQVYNTFDWGIKDDDGYYFILGRTDDVINVAGHRLGTREIEEAICSHAAVAEVAVVGVADTLKGQVPMAFVVLKDPAAAATLEAEQALQAAVMLAVDGYLGAVGRPARIVFVSALPKTRSGKLLRRTIQAVCEGRDTGDLTTIEDPTALQQLKSRWALAP
jgi:propionyl-CoA synthetase